MLISLDLNMCSGNQPAGTAAFNGQFASVLDPLKTAFLIQSDIGVTQSGGLVTVVADQATSPHNATASGALRPTYSAAALSGKPSLIWSGSNALRSTYALPNPAVTPYTLGLVFRQLSWIAGSYIIGDDNGVAGTLYSSDITPKIRAYNGAGGGGSPVAMPLNTWECTESYVENTVQDTLRRGSTSASGFALGTSVGTGLVIGNGGGSLTLGANIELVHAVVYLGRLPAAWRAGVASYYGPTVQV